MPGRSARRRMRKKRPTAPETALRQRIEKLRGPRGLKVPALSKGRLVERRANAPQEWALVVFAPQTGRLPTQEELCAAIDDGRVGRWYEAEKHSKWRKVRSEVVVDGLHGSHRVSHAQLTRKVEAKPANNWQDRRNRENKAIEAKFRKRRVLAKLADMLGEGTIEPHELAASMEALYAEEARLERLQKVWERHRKA